MTKVIFYSKIFTLKMKLSCSEVNFVYVAIKFYNEFQEVISNSMKLKRTIVKFVERKHSLCETQNSLGSQKICC